MATLFFKKGQVLLSTNYTKQTPPLFRNQFWMIMHIKTFLLQPYAYQFMA